jgi:hypothetical protein
MSKIHFSFPSRSEITLTLALLSPFADPPKVTIPVFIPLDLLIYFSIAIYTKSREFIAR